MAKLPWRKQKPPPARPGALAGAGEGATSSSRGTVMLTVQKYGLGSVLGALCVADAVLILFFVLAAAHLVQTASAMVAEVDRPEIVRNSTALNGTAANGTPMGRGIDLSDADRLKLVTASEMKGLAATAAILAAYMGLLDVMTLVAARNTGAVSRLQRASSHALRASGFLLVPQTLALLVLCFYSLARGRRVRAEMCARSEDEEARGCFPSARVIAALLGLVAVLNLFRTCVTLSFNSAVKTSTERYAEMTELESAAEVTARQERMAAISAKHQALRDKYIEKGYIKDGGRGAGSAAQ